MTMTAKVIKRFRDKRTGFIHKPGDVIEVTAERFAEINAAKNAPFVEAVSAIVGDNNVSDSDTLDSAGGNTDDEHSDGGGVSETDTLNPADEAVDGKPDDNDDTVAAVVEAADDTPGVGADEAETPTEEVVPVDKGRKASGRAKK